MTNKKDIEKRIDEFWNLYSFRDNRLGLVKRQKGYIKKFIFKELSNQRKEIIEEIEKEIPDMVLAKQDGDRIVILDENLLVRADLEELLTKLKKAGE